MMRDPYVLDAVNTLAGFVGLENADDVTQVEVDVDTVRVTRACSNVDGERLTSGDQFVTQTFAKKWRVAHQ